MNETRLVKISKFLSKHLRHDPEGLGLTLAPGGWVAVDDLLTACARRGFGLSRAELDEVVAQNNKQRFSFDEARTRIRANQGHSVEVDLHLAPSTPPAVLFHGTGRLTAGIIGREGLEKMRRHPVRPVIFAVDAAAMALAGHLFLRSDNGVWLTEAVPPGFLSLYAPFPPRT